MCTSGRGDTLRAVIRGLQGESSGSAAVPHLMLKGLQIRLGPELRAMYPVVVNMGISGDIEVNGRADISLLRLKGLVYLDSGEVQTAPGQDFHLLSRAVPVETKGYHQLTWPGMLGPWRWIF